MATLPSRFIKECNKVSTASHIVRALVCTAWLIPKMADCGGDPHKSRQKWKESRGRATATYGKPQSP